jgi:hypothetical protein
VKLEKEKRHLVKTIFTPCDRWDFRGMNHFENINHSPVWGWEEVSLASANTFIMIYPRQDTLFLSKNTSKVMLPKLGTDFAILVGIQRGTKVNYHPKRPLSIYLI